MRDATPPASFGCRDLSVLCRLDGLGRQVTGHRLDRDRAVLTCQYRVINSIYDDRVLVRVVRLSHHADVHGSWVPPPELVPALRLRRSGR